MAGFPGLGISLSDSKHIANIQITEDGKFLHYDSANRQPIPPFETAQDLTEFLYQYTFNKAVNTKTNSIDWMLDANKFYEKREEIPSLLQAKQSVVTSESSPNGFTDLHFALMENNNNKVREILDKNPSLVDIADNHGVTPLRMALWHYNEEAFKLIMSEKTKQAMSGYHLSHDLDFVELVNAGDNFVQFVLNNGWITVDDKDKNGRNLLHAAAINENLELTLKLISSSNFINEKDSLKNTPLMYALGEDYFTAEKNEDCNEKYNNLYEEKEEKKLIYDRNRALVETLLSAQDIQLNLQNDFGLNALMCALENKVSDEIILLLIKNETLDINQIDDNGYDALMFAIYHNASLAVIQAILDKKELDINKQDKDKFTALMYATSRYCDFGIIERMLKRGARPDLNNNDGETALELIHDRKLSGEFVRLIKRLNSQTGRQTLFFTTKAYEESMAQKPPSPGSNMEPENTIETQSSSNNQSRTPKSPKV